MRGACDRHDRVLGDPTCGVLSDVTTPDLTEVRCYRECPARLICKSETTVSNTLPVEPLVESQEDVLESIRPGPDVVIFGQ